MNNIENSTEKSAQNLYVFVVFNGTMDAINFEECIQNNGFSGRLIPVPFEISAHCGMCWMEEIKNQSRLEEFIEKQGLSYKKIHVMEY